MNSTSQTRKMKIGPNINIMNETHGMEIWPNKSGKHHEWDIWNDFLISFLIINSYNHEKITIFIIYIAK